MSFFQVNQFSIFFHQHFSIIDPWMDRIQKLIELVFSSPLKSVKNYGIAWMGLNIYEYHDFQPKIWGGRR